MGSHTDWLVGSGEMTELIRAHPWSGTPLGDLGTWSPALQSAVNLVLNCPFPMALLWGPDFTLLYNDGYRLIAGAKHPAALGKSSREIWPEVWHINQPIFKSVREKDQSIFLEDQLFPIRRSSDQLEEAYFTISYSPVYDLTLRPQEAPQARGILVTLLETTSKIIERKKLKNLLIESQRYRDILDQIPAHIYMKDINSKYQYANKTTLELFRCTLEELKGREDEFFFPLETVARLKASDRRVFSGETTRVELEVRDPLGGQRVYDELKTPLYRDIYKNEISGLIAISTDITERKHTEKNLRLSRERFRVAINALGAGFFMRDADGKIVESNVTFQEIIKLNPDQLRELDTNNLGFKLIREDGSSLPPEQLPSNLSSIHGEPIRHVVIGLVRDSCPPQWLSVNATPVQLEDQAAGVVVTVFDISDRKELELKLSEAIKLRDDFVSIASHELKNPISALLLNLQLLNKVVGKLEKKQSLEKLASGALSAAEAAENLLADLLDVTVIRAGKLKLDPRSIELRALIQECTTLSEEPARRAGSQIRLEPGDPLEIVCDPLKIRQVLLNLLSNAIKYGQGGSIEVTLDKVGEQAVIRIQDHGLGMSAEFQSQLFERFTRESTRLGIPGLGLGLYISSQIAHAHGGKIQVKSEPGHGSVFSVILPLTAKQAQVA